MHEHLQSSADRRTLVTCGQICSCIGRDALGHRQRQTLPMLHWLCMVIPRCCHNLNERKGSEELHHLHDSNSQFSFLNGLRLMLVPHS